MRWGFRLRARSRIFERTPRNQTCPDHEALQSCRSRISAWQIAKGVTCRSFARLKNPPASPSCFAANPEPESCASRSPRRRRARDRRRSEEAGARHRRIVLRISTPATRRSARFVLVEAKTLAEIEGGDQRSSAGRKTQLLRRDHRLPPTGGTRSSRRTEVVTKDGGGGGSFFPARRVARPPRKAQQREKQIRALQIAPLPGGLISKSARLRTHPRSDSSAKRHPARHRQEGGYLSDVAPRSVQRAGPCVRKC